MKATRTVLAALGAAALGTMGVQPLAQAVDSSDIVAQWEMNESSGAVMRDSSGNGIDGEIGSAVKTGFTFAGATGYQWTKTNPNEPPAKPERLVTVDDGRLNPGYRDFAITVRFRTTHSAGNMLQKGQATNKGGYFKWQNVRGKITCLVRGYDEQGNRLSKAVNSGTTPLNDGQWHTLTCERTADQVTLRIDGSSKVRRARGATGSISNNVPLTFAGKPNCDQVRVSCDYFSGEMDYVHFAIAGGAGGGDGGDGGDGGGDGGGDSGGADTTAPTVADTSPNADATGVRRGANVKATFSEQVTGVNESTMTLTRAANGDQLGANLSYDSASREVTMNPDRRLPPNTRLIVAFETGITDDAGNALKPMTWSFTTAG
ncbi:MAG TPA: Ig-like domain-containing protein [Marmoricola sp.]|nr:Ig-like domain-containing protein [Marmoricola sp.]